MFERNTYSLSNYTYIIIIYTNTDYNIIPKDCGHNYLRITPVMIVIDMRATVGCTSMVKITVYAYVLIE